jgi:hypothetical protein
MHRALSNYSAVEPPGKQWAAQGLLLSAACLQLLLWIILGTAVTWWHLSTKNGRHARGVQDSAAKQHHPPGVSSQQDPCTHQHQLPIRPVQARRHTKSVGHAEYTTHHFQVILQELLAWLRRPDGAALRHIRERMGPA